VDRGITRPLSENIRSEVIRSGKYKVMERSQMDKVLKEQAFQMTGCVAKECMVEAGQLLGVGKIIIGSLGLVGRTYHLSLSQVNVETGETEQMAVETCKCEVDELIESSGRAARRLMGEAVPETPAVTTVGTGTPTTRMKTEKATPPVVVEEPSKGSGPDEKGKLTDAWGDKYRKPEGMEEIPFSQLSFQDKVKVIDALIDDPYRQDFNKTKMFKQMVENYGTSRQAAWVITQDMLRNKERSVFKDFPLFRYPQPKKEIEYLGPLENIEPAASPPPTAKTYQDPTTGMEFVFIKGGCYQMGHTFGDGSSDEKPVHEVCVDDFYLGKYEVTQGQWREIMGQNPSGYKNGDRYPVETVSWNDAQEFIGRFSQKTGKVYRLPTEAEWEYAARSGGKKYKYSWGNGSPSGNIADESAKRKDPRWARVWQGYDDGYTETAPVGSFSPNELGLYDMTGNVWEWCSDWYGKSYYGQSPRANPQGPEGPDGGQVAISVNLADRVIRGGSWVSDPGDLRASYRIRGGPSFWVDVVGFRLVLSAR
jgi:formylglycine-generating enzyme required for sulfatase activity